MHSYVELFAGAGGWTLAAQRLGLKGIGIESNPAACATRRAMDFPTIERDVRSCFPGNYDRVEGFIASPPCQTFSAAGKGSGRAEMEKVLEALRGWSWKGDFADERTGLILEPLRWILGRCGSGNPFRWIAMEQVPACLPVWQAYQCVLEQVGYFTEVGLVNAEQHGVPQTRKRAVLLAHWEHQVALPVPTHSRFNAGTLLPAPVSMSDVLAISPDAEVVSNYGTGGDARNRGTRRGDQPSATVTTHINRNKVWEQGIVRTFTPTEAGVLQSFPGFFSWRGSRTEQYEQVGNAIPPLLAQAVLECLIADPRACMEAPVE